MGRNSHNGGSHGSARRHTGFQELWVLQDKVLYLYTEVFLDRQLKQMFLTQLFSHTAFFAVTPQSQPSGKSCRGERLIQTPWLIGFLASLPISIGSYLWQQTPGNCLFQFICHSNHSRTFKIKLLWKSKLFLKNTDPSEPQGAGGAGTCERNASCYRYSQGKAGSSWYQVRRAQAERSL